MSDTFDDIDVPGVQVQTGDENVGPTFPPVWEDQCYEYSETCFYRNTGGTLTVSVRLTNVDDYAYPPAFDVIAEDLEVFDDD